jgi:arylsulfatase
MFAYAFSNQDGDKYRYQQKYKTRIGASEPLAPGKHAIAFDFAYDGGGPGKGGQGTLAVDGKKVAEGRIELTQPLRFSLDESFDVGQDTGSPVIDEYDAKMPFKFTGTLNRIEFKLSPEDLTNTQRASLQWLRTDLALAVQ